LYTLIFVDVTLIHHQRESKALEVILQVINMFVVLCTLINHPKRALNWVRALRIWKGSRNDEYGIGRVSEEVRELQESVGKAYEWYVYDGEKAFICSPARLTGILTLWNLGSLAQYGLSGK